MSMRAKRDMVLLVGWRRGNAASRAAKGRPERTRRLGKVNYLLAGKEKPRLMPGPRRRPLSSFAPAVEALLKNFGILPGPRGHHPQEYANQQGDHPHDAENDVHDARQYGEKRFHLVPPRFHPTRERPDVKGLSGRRSLLTFRRSDIVWTYMERVTSSTQSGGIIMELKKILCAVDLEDAIAPSVE